MPINPGDSKQDVIDTINAIITSVGIDPSGNTNTTEATDLLNQVAEYLNRPGLTNAMEGGDARAIINNLENGPLPSAGAELIAWDDSGSVEVMIQWDTTTLTQYMEWDV